MAVITTPCNTISGCEADLGCGSGRQSRRRKSFCSAGRASLPEDAGACHRGFTSSSVASSVGRQYIPGAPSCVPRNEEFRGLEVGAIRAGAQPLQALLDSPLGLQGAVQRAAELQRAWETELTHKGCVGQG